MPGMKARLCIVFQMRSTTPVARISPSCSAIQASISRKSSLPCAKERSAVRSRLLGLARLTFLRPRLYLGQDLFSRIIFSASVLFAPPADAGVDRVPVAPEIGVQRVRGDVVVVCRMPVCGFRLGQAFGGFSGLPGHLSTIARSGPGCRASEHGALCPRIA